RSASMYWGPRSTTPTSISTRTMCAARPAITPAIATRNSTKWSTSNRGRPIRRSVKKLAWDIDYKLQQDLARPIIYHLRAATCWQPEVKGLTMMTNSQYNGWRFEDVWLDK